MGAEKWRAAVRRNKRQERRERRGGLYARCRAHLRKHHAGKYDLNDRRSGVKGPGPGTAATRGVKLSANDGKGSSAGVVVNV